MGVNLFVPINKADYDASSQNVEMIDAAVNHLGREDGEPFVWAGLFEGAGGPLLTLEQALAFEPDAAPWFVMTLDDGFYSEADDGHWGAYTNFFWCHPDAAPSIPDTQWGYTVQNGPADWQALLRDFKCDSVLFFKARN